MNDTRKDSTILKPALTAVAFILALATAPATMADSAASGVSAYVQTCLDAWGDSPASSYCASTGVSRNEVDASFEASYCTFRGDCSLTANVGSGTNTVSTTWTAYFNRSATVDDTSTFDLCFHDGEEAAGYSMTMRTGCTATETTSGTATANGLPTPSD